MRAIALVALLAGCTTLREHPIAATVANVGLVAGAGVCTVECDGAARGVSEGVLITELAVSSTVAAWLAAWLIAYASEEH